MLGPGPEDLQLIGFNLMAPERRADVLETSRRTSLAALGAPLQAGSPPAGRAAATPPPPVDPRAADLDRPVIDLDAAEETQLIDLDADLDTNLDGRAASDAPHEIGGERA